MNKATGSKIDHLYLGSRIALDQYIFRLQIAVNQTKSVNEIKGCENLLSNLLESSNIEVLFLFNFTVVFTVFI